MRILYRRIGGLENYRIANTRANRLYRRIGGLEMTHGLTERQ